MKVVVTGANGYIGRHIIKSLVKEGCDVVAVILSPPKDEIASDRIQYYYGDIFKLSEKDKEELFRNTDILCHLAWRAGFNHRDPSHYLDVINHYNFLVSAANYGVKKISVAGTMHEVGYFIGPVTETTACNPINPYGIAKNFLRQSMIDFASIHPQLCLQWLRFFYITGDDRFNNSIFTKILLAEENGEKYFPLNSGEMLYDFIDILELSKQVTDILLDAKGGIFNCCSGKPKSLRSAVEEFIDKNNLKIKPKYGLFPDRPYDSMAIWGKR